VQHVPCGVIRGTLALFLVLNISAHITTTSDVFHSSLPVPFSLQEITLIYITDGPMEDTLAVEFIIPKISFIVVAANEFKDTPALRCAIMKVAFVYSTVGVLGDTLSFPSSCNIIAGKTIAVAALKYTFPMKFVLNKPPFIRRPVVGFPGTAAMS